MQYLLFEDESRLDLLPLTFTRPAFALRAGIFTNHSRWSRALAQEVHTLAAGYLSRKFSSRFIPEADTVWINGKLHPDSELCRLAREISVGTAFLSGSGEILMARFKPHLLPESYDELFSLAVIDTLGLKRLEYTAAFSAFRFPQDLFLQSSALTHYDFELITRDRKSAPLSDQHSRIYGADNIFAEEGVKIRAAIIDAEDGPVYFGKAAAVQAGAMIQGTHAFGAHSVVQMGAKLRGDSTFGPHVRVGGEVGNSVIMGYSNKGHDGYLGNSVLGYWCNLGADTNTSNLKNNYAQVKLWNYRAERFVDTGLQFCGLIMGDHSKCGINTMFNTGTVVGVSANIFGAGFPRNLIPSFSWGGVAGLSTYQLPKAFETAEKVMMRRKKPFDQNEKEILEQVFEESRKHRVWEKKS
jgi:UDP-N-acetylglucosamine diphosphorylase/glucosamine-1-phosphate N-acetyltransferase